jgi:Protein of unknown function DUF262/Protein of unknown function (DUF1524)
MPRLPGIQIHGSEYQLLRIFSDEFSFRIPHYQRPYAWGPEEAGELIEDLRASLGEPTVPVEALEPYFLGSLVLIKQDGQPIADVVDGQQRLTTITMLLAAATSSYPEIRDLVEQFLFQPANELAGTEARYRLAIRERDETFFRAYVQDLGGISALESLDPAKLTDSQRAIRVNTIFIRDVLRRIGFEETKRLIAFMVQRTYVVAVSTPSLDSAYRIFSVLNERGLQLSVADILKARVLGTVPSAQMDRYTDLWEDYEELLGRDSFAQLMSHIRMIYARAKLRESVVREFDLHVFAAVPAGKDFLDQILVPYADAMDAIIHERFTASDRMQEVNTTLAWLNKIDNSDWLAPALFWLARHGNDAEATDEFLSDLERLAASMLIRRVDVNRRVERYSRLISAIEAGDDLTSPTSPLQLTKDERRETLSELGGPIYQAIRVRSYALLRLDAALSGGGATYDYPTVTIEHVLPQTVQAGSSWATLFDDAAQQKWTHALANLVLLTRRKNSQAQNYDFKTKKTMYFQGPGGVSPFVLTTQVLASDEWSPAALEARQTALIGTLRDLWRLDDAATGHPAIRAGSDPDSVRDQPGLFKAGPAGAESGADPDTSPWQSLDGQLRAGDVYTRAGLKDLFDIKDATINNGVFRVSDRQEIWLFITEQKQSHVVQYKDELVGDILHWQGQALGRTDDLIVYHKRDGNCLLVFYRKAKAEFPGAGFRLEGRFDYVSHSGGQPANFVLKRAR